MSKYILSALLILGSFHFALAEEHHDHDHEGDAQHEEKHEEENPSVGPNNGITEFNEEKGFKLSAEAVKHFSLKTVRLTKGEEWTVPVTAVLHSGEEINLYRVRDGFYKRVDFKATSKSGKDLKVKSNELKSGDEIVTEGVGFLRAADIVASGGAPHGHSH